MTFIRLLTFCSVLAVVIGCTPTAVKAPETEVSSVEPMERPVSPQADRREVSFEESIPIKEHETDGPSHSLNDTAEAHLRCEGYRYGERGYPEDHEQAFRWCTESAELGDPGGQSILASLYYFGLGAEQNYRDALYWYTLAANRRKPYAALTLSYMYFYGQGTDVDVETAYMYLSRSADLGNEEAQELLDLYKDNPAQPVPSEGEIQALLDKHGVAKVAPVYPIHAQRLGLEGYVIVDYCIDREGRTHNIWIIESVPEGVFDSAALAAAKHFRYQPEIVNGEPMERHGVQNKFTFELYK